MRVLQEASDIVKRKWGTAGRGWKTFLIISIIILSVLGLVYFVIWSFFKLVKGLAAGTSSGGNYNLYFPRAARRR